MNATYQLKLCDDDENVVAVIDSLSILSLDWVIADNEVGQMTIELPQLWPWDYFPPFRTIIMERDAGRGYEIVENRRWFLLSKTFTTDANGNRSITIKAADQNVLLKGWIVAYDSGSSQADKIDQYDDVCKLVWTENVVNPTDITRALAGASTANGTGDAPTDTFSLARRSLLSVCQDCANSSSEAGTRLVFDLVWTAPGCYEMRTYIGQHATDHTADGPDPRYITLKNASLTEDWSDAATVMTAGGQGKKQARLIQTATNTTALTVSKYARIEGWTSANDAETEAAVLQRATAELWRKRPRLVLTGEIEDTEGLRYGIDYGWGDVVSAGYVQADGSSVTMDCHITKVSGQYARGAETLATVLRGEL